MAFKRNQYLAEAKKRRVRAVKLYKNGNGKSMQEIADMEKVSRQRVSQWIAHEKKSQG